MTNEAATQVSESHGDVSLTWLGQAGFAVRSAAGRTCLIDPYLSDFVEWEIGTKRIVEPPFDPTTSRVEVLVSSHSHPDHLDRPTCLAVWKANPDVRFVGPPANESRLVGQGIPHDRIVSLERGETTECAGFLIRGEFARHDVPGWLCEDALSLVIETSSVRMLHSGDTEYDARFLRAHRNGRFDVALLVMNGSGGNMNAYEAALLAFQIRPALAIPMHYGMWDDAGYGDGATLDPNVFAETCRRLGGPVTRVLELGQTINLSPRS